MGVCREVGVWGGRGFEWPGQAMRGAESSQPKPQTKSPNWAASSRPAPPQNRPPKPLENHPKTARNPQATVTDEGLCRFGWSTRAGRLDLGTDRHGFGYGGTGKKSHNKW